MLLSTPSVFLESTASRVADVPLFNSASHPPRSFRQTASKFDRRMTRATRSRLYPESGRVLKVVMRFHRAQDTFCFLHFFYPFAASHHVIERLQHSLHIFRPNLSYSHRLQDFTCDQLLHLSPQLLFLTILTWIDNSTVSRPLPSTRIGDVSKSLTRACKHEVRAAWSRSWRIGWCRPWPMASAIG